MGRGNEKTQVHGGGRKQARDTGEEQSHTGQGRTSRSEQYEWWVKGTLLGLAAERRVGGGGGERGGGGGRQAHRAGGWQAGRFAGRCPTAKSVMMGDWLCPLPHKHLLFSANAAALEGWEERRRRRPERCCPRWSPHTSGSPPVVSVKGRKLPAPPGAGTTPGLRVGTQGWSRTPGHPKPCTQSRSFTVLQAQCLALP